MTITSASTSGPPPRSAGAIRVMLADDHRMLRDGLRRSLEHHGLAVVAEAADGEEAVRVASEVRPDVLLMDITMPLVDGVEATRVVRQAHPETQVIILTMHSDAELMARAAQAGACGYLVKDCSTEEVVAAIRLVVGGDTAPSPQVAHSMLAELHRVPDSAAGEDGPVISRREEEVLQLVADGLSIPEVAATLYISAKTVKNHLGSIYQKLEARDRTQAVLRGVRMGIIRLD